MRSLMIVCVCVHKREKERMCVRAREYGYPAL